MNKVTIKDIAKLAGVSNATVSRALSGSPEIGEATRVKILELCKQMNYVPDFVARSMVMKRTNTIGLIAPTIDNPFMGELINNIEICAREKGYSMVVCTSSYDSAIERSQMDLLIGRRVDGVIVVPSGAETAENLAKYPQEIPIVYISENLQNFKQSFVSVDNYNGAKIAVEYLYGHGHRNIAFLGYRQNSFSHNLRKDGFTDTCAKLGIENRIIENKFKRSSMEAGYEISSEYFSHEHKETAVFCASDSIAIGFMQAADEHNIRIPDDISVIGFDNIPFSSLPRINLTTVQQPKEQMAKQAVEMITEMIETGLKDVSSRILLPSIIERKSCNTRGNV